MRRLATTLSTCLVGVTLTWGGTLSVSQAVLGARTSTFGEVGAFSFPDVGGTGATCVYKKGRLTSISLPAPSASGRQQWEPTGQYALWAARLEAKSGRGGWKSVAGTRYSEAPVIHVGQLKPLPPVSIPRIASSADKKYRVVETIYWYFNNRSAPVVQGRATTVVKHYKSLGKTASSCVGATGTKLPPLRTITNEELDAVRVSFTARAHGADVKYSIKSGSLPPGLRLSKKGVAKGKVLASAVNATTDYHSIQARTFSFVIRAKANGQKTTKAYAWKVYDTAFVMPSYYGLYGCGDCGDAPDESAPNISDLGPKISFGCTTQAQPGIPANKYSVIYRQDYQKTDGTLGSSAGLTFRYGDVFKWWYYNVSC